MDVAFKISDLSISVIEPSSMQWRVIQQHLNEMGVTNIDHFVDGKTALNDMRGFQPDLVISSMHLPDITATDLVQTMRGDADLEGVPFMVISSEDSDEYLEPIRQAGVVAILPKPFDKAILTKALYSTLEFIEPDKTELADINIDELHVLVVDDSSTARKHISRVLRNLGVENLTLAVNGKEAVDILADNFFDLIVTDYNMPEMNGKELAEYVRNESQQSQVPILMVTSEANHDHLAGIKESGVSAICDKPFEPGEVKQLIREIIS